MTRKKATTSASAIAGEAAWDANLMPGELHGRFCARALVPQEGKEAPASHAGRSHVAGGSTACWKAAVIQHPYPWAWSGSVPDTGGMPGRGQ